MTNLRNQVKVGLLAMLVLLVLVISLYEWRIKAKGLREQDALRVMEWEGFGPEMGVYNFTVVTAMLDIGRGQWKKQKRSYNTYLLYMERVLRLDVNMVVFVEPKGRPFIDWMRRGREARTKVINFNFKDLPNYRFRDRMEEIMGSDSYRADNELYRKNLCEAFIPEYDILQLSKFFFVNRAIDMDPFHTNYFTWLDAGYGHGDDVFPVNGIWIPKLMIDHPDQLTFIERDPGVTKFRDSKPFLHKMSINIMAGLFFAGGKRAFKEAYSIQQRLLSQWLDEGIVDDDQTMYMWMYYEKPSLFHLVRGDWDDVFKLFGTLPTNS